MTRKIFALISALLILFSFSACKKSKTKDIEVIRGASTSESGKVDGSEKNISGTKIDPFKGLDITITGISPFCQVSINTLGCDYEVQEKVKFLADKEYYANGEKATITASLNYGNSGYVLVSETKQFDIANMPEYVTSVEGLNLDSLKKERDDFVTAECAKAVSKDLVIAGFFGRGCKEFTKTITSKELVDTYSVFVKANKLPTFSLSKTTPYNKICFLYHFKCITIEDKKVDYYVNVCAENIVKYPDGTIKWGSESSDALDFQADVSSASIEDITVSTITNLSADYNIKRITV